MLALGLLADFFVLFGVASNLDSKAWHWRVLAVLTSGVQLHGKLSFGPEREERGKEREGGRKREREMERERAAQGART